MHTLFLDLASHSDTPSQGASIACCDEQATRAIEFVDHRMSDDQLMPTIEKVLKEANYNYKDLTHIAVVKGPGGFTSLRMAVTLANVLADQLGIVGAGVHLSEVYTARTKKQDTRNKIQTSNKKQGEKNGCDSFLWLHSTKKTGLFVRGFGSLADKWPEPILISIEDFAAQVPENAMWAGELIPAHRDILAGKHLQPATIMKLEETLPTFLASLSYTKELILPWYGRGW